MRARLLEFAAALRAAGVPVAVSENLDALRALRVVPLEDRSTVRAALRATMIKADTHEHAFDVLFNLYFGAAGDGAVVDDAQAVDPQVDPEAFQAELAGALAGSGGSLGELAGRAVSLFGRVEDSPSDSLYFEYPVWRALDLDLLVRRLEAEVGAIDPLELLLQRDELRRNARRFRILVQEDVRRRVAARRGPEAVARYAVRPLLEDVDLATATATEIAELRRAIAPLARKLATRAAVKQRRARHGRLDVRRTVRHSLSTGGVPFQTYQRRRAPHRPELFVLCDVSDSVARFARFSLMLVHALQAQFSRIRSFAFIDTVDEVTHYFEDEDFLAAVDRMNVEAEVIWLDRNSNYGTSLERFRERYGAEIGPKTTLLILGDARSNNRAPKQSALKALASKTHRTYWLNPEQQAYWDTGDSLASLYGDLTDGMIEVRTLRHLERFVGEIL